VAKKGFSLHFPGHFFKNPLFLVSGVLLLIVLLLIAWKVERVGKWTKNFKKI